MPQMRGVDELSAWEGARQCLLISHALLIIKYSDEDRKSFIN